MFVSLFKLSFCFLSFQTFIFSSHSQRGENDQFFTHGILLNQQQQQQQQQQHEYNDNDNGSPHSIKAIKHSSEFQQNFKSIDNIESRNDKLNNRRSRRSGYDDYSNGDDSGDDDTQVVRTFQSEKPATKLVHVTREVSDEQPNVFVYLPTSIKQEEHVNKRIVSTITHDDDDDDSVKKSVPYDDEVYPEPVPVPEEKIIHSVPVQKIHTHTTYVQQPEEKVIHSVPVQRIEPVLTRPVYVQPVQPIIQAIPVRTAKLVRTVPVPATRIIAAPIVRSYVKTAHVAPVRQIVRPPLVRSVPVIKAKTVLFTPPVPRKTTTVLTTHYTPATKTVVYEAEHVPVRSAPVVTRVLQPAYSFKARNYHSDWVPITTPNRAYVKSALRSKIYSSPALSFVRRQDYNQQNRQINQQQSNDADDDYRTEESRNKKTQIKFKFHNNNFQSNNNKTSTIKRF